MNDVERALSQIADIHARMAASTRFRGLAPEAVAVTALLALFGSLAQLAWPEMLTGDPLRYIALWVGVACAAALVVAIESLARSRRLHGRLADRLIESALRHFVPFGAAGALITFVIVTTAPASAWLLPGLWQIIVALAGFTAGATLPRAIVWPAAWYLLCGTLVLASAGNAGHLSPWMMGVPFILGQAAVAFILHRAAQEDHGRS
ncbi:hypothetical protein [Sphingosinicella terrae]|uniref:hypothetical protein n=1 Tax=Sphingosinicella terrae TaxID=2172047 RepID=UPI0013B3FD7B|nr:hypothetical protein [Sphingosinicella terrae]